MLTEKLVRAEFLWIQNLHQRLRVLGEGGREHNHLVVLAHSLEEVLHSWSYLDVNLTYLALNLDR